MEQKKSREAIDAEIISVHAKIGELGNYFASEEFQESEYFSKEEKGNMQAALRELQIALADEINKREKKYQRGELEEFFIGDLETVINGVRDLIDEVVLPVSQGENLEGEKIEGSRDEITSLAKEIKSFVDNYKNNTAALPLEKNLLGSFFHWTKAITNALVGALAKIGGVSPDETTKKGSYPVKSPADGRFAEEETAPEVESDEFINPEKVFIIGHEKSGKSELIEQLIYSNASFTSAYEPTLGVDYRGIVSIGGHRKAISEVGGNEQFRNMGKPYIKEADAIFMTLSAEMLQGEVDTAVKALNTSCKDLIDSAPEGTPIHLVITKTDVLGKDLDKVEQKFDDKVKAIVEEAQKVGINIESVTFTSAKYKKIEALEDVVFPVQQESQSTPRLK